MRFGGSFGSFGGFDHFWFVFVGSISLNESMRGFHWNQKNSFNFFVTVVRQFGQELQRVAHSVQKQ